MMLQRGEKFTIAGVYDTKPNPDRRWWQFWKPLRIADKEKLTVFEIL